MKIYKKQVGQDGKREYLDLSIDPVVPMGISAELENKILRNGWEKFDLEFDLFGVAQFKDDKGLLYCSDGWIKKGTKAFKIKENADGIMSAHVTLQTSGSPFVILGEDKYGGSGGQW